MSNHATLLFRTPLWVTLPSDPEVSLLLKPLSFKTLHIIQESLTTSKNLPEFSTYTNSRSLIIEHIIDTRGAVGFNDYVSLVSQLGLSDVAYLDKCLQKLSVPTKEQYEQLSEGLEIQFDSRFKEENFDCKVCQSRGFDKVRACKFLDPSEHTSPFRMVVKGKTYINCPISMVDMNMIQQAYIAYSIYSKGFLPDSGNLGDQTIWFVKASQAYEQQLKITEADMMNSKKKK